MGHQLFKGGNMKFNKRVIGFPFTFTNRGGSYYSASNIVKVLKDFKDYEPVVFLPEIGKNSDLFDYNNVKVLSYNLNAKIQKKVYLSYGLFKKFISVPYQIVVYLKALKMLKIHPCDLIHINDDATLIAWGFAAKTRKIPVIWNVRQDKGSQILDILRKKIATYLIFNSEASTMRFKKKLENQTIVYNLFNQKKNINKLNHFYTGNSDKITIGFVGTLQKRKRPEWFLKAAIKASKKYSNLKFIIAGRDYSNGYYTGLIDQARKDFEKTIDLHYLGEVREIGTIFSSLDIFCLTSTSESFGRVVIEALLNDTAVIATRVGGVKEIIKDGYDGILVSPDYYGDFEKSLFRLIEDKAERIKLSSNGKEILKTKFNPKEQIDKLKNVYDKLLENQK